MKPVNIITAILLFFCYSAAHASSESVAEKERQLREKILQKDQQRREQILKKFTDFQNRVKNFAPDFKMKIPVDPSLAEDVKEQDHDSAAGKTRGYKAFAADSYRLRSLPYDSDKEFTATVKRGDKLEVLMKPVVEKRKDMPSLTKDWLLVKTSDGAEGYIPLNMVLNNKPKKTSMKDEYDSLMYSKLDDIPEMNDGSDSPQLLFVQYGGRGGGDGTLPTGKMKVNTAILKVRTEPSLDAEVAGTLNKNDEVNVEEYSSHEDYYQGKSSKWARITSDSVSGWVFASYLSVPGSSDSAGGAEVNEPAEFLKKGKDLYVKPDILRVRDAPDEMGTVLFSLQNKDSVEIVEVEPEPVTLGGKKSIWVKVKFLEYEGWVFGAFLSENKRDFEEGDDINNIFQIPLAEGSYFVSSKYGKRILKGKVSNHTGIDLAAPCGTEVTSSADGTVITAVSDDRNCSSCGYGSYVIIEHKNGYRTVYGHLTTVKVTVGQKITSGQKVGTVGNTGHSYGCHLHFEIRAYEEFVDPMNYMHP